MSIPSFYTGRASSTPDITLATSNILATIQEWKVSDRVSGSDHRYISFNLTGDLPAYKGRVRYKSKYGGHSRMLEFITAEKEELLEQIRNASSPQQLDACTEALVSTLQAACKKAYRLTKPSPTSNFQWWSQELFVQRKRVRAMRRRAQAPGLEEAQRNRLRDMYKKSLGEYKQSINRAKRKSWMEFCTTTEERFGLAFNLAFSKISQKTLLHAVDGKEGVARLLRKNFPLQPSLSTANVNTQLDWDAEEEPPVTREELHRIVQKLKQNKAPGPDGIDGNIIKALVPLHLDLLIQFFNRCLEVRHFPTPFRTGDVVLLRKPNKDPALAEAYRPICLLPTLGKILEAILCRRLAFYLQRSSPLSARQYGFCKGKSTQEAISNITDEMAELEGKGQHWALVCLDIHKAFDHLRKDTVLTCLAKRRCPHLIHEMVNSYLTDR